MDILYQDDRIVVAVKPVGVLSTDEPGGMPELLRARLGTPCIRTVHRLDAATGGVMPGPPPRPPSCPARSGTTGSGKSIWRWSGATRDKAGYGGTCLGETRYAG